MDNCDFCNNQFCWAHIMLRLLKYQKILPKSSPRPKS